MFCAALPIVQSDMDGILIDMYLDFIISAVSANIFYLTLHPDKLYTLINFMEGNNEIVQKLEFFSAVLYARFRQNLLF